MIKKRHFALLILLVGAWLVFNKFGIQENFDNNGHRRLADYLPNYIVDVQRRCLPGERDEGRICIKEGCPDGMKRGSGSGQDTCYAPCVDGFESNGMSRCYKKCPPGWKTNNTTCINPKHEYKKDVIPCQGCIPPPEADAVLNSAFITPASPSDNVVVMTPTGYGYPQNTVSGKMTFPHQHSAGINYNHGHPYNTPHSHINKINVRRYKNRAVAAGYILSQVESFDDVNAHKMGQKTENGNGNRNGNKEKAVNYMGNIAQARARGEQTVPVTNLPAQPQPENGVRMMGDKPCPFGYTLSGDLCYENCPSFYRDEGDKCVRDEYIIDRESYDRGAGIPYLTKRKKFDFIHQGL